MLVEEGVATQQSNSDLALVDLELERVPDEVKRLMEDFDSNVDLVEFQRLQAQKRDVIGHLQRKLVQVHVVNVHVVAGEKKRRRRTRRIEGQSS